MSVVGPSLHWRPLGRWPSWLSPHPGLCSVLGPFLLRQILQLFFELSVLELVHEACLAKRVVGVVEASLAGWRMGDAIVRDVLLPSANSECWSRCCEPDLTPLGNSCRYLGITSASTDGSMDGRKPRLVSVNNMRLDKVKAINKGFPRQESREWDTEIKIYHRNRT